MDDMNAFERQLSVEVTTLMGPVRPVDDLAIFNNIATTQSPKWRFQSMFSATKFVVASVIVALFGGFLLSGVLTQPSSDDGLPAAGSSLSASPNLEPTTQPEAPVERDILPGVDLVTEEVAPGVFKVTDDGAGHGFGRLGGIAISPDGAVWIHRDNGALFKVGQPGSHDVSVRQDDRSTADLGALTFDRDGSLFALNGGKVVMVEPDTPSRSRGEDGRTTGLIGIGPDEPMNGTSATALAVMSVGSIWATRSAGMSNSGRTRVMQLVGEQWIDHLTDDGLGASHTLPNAEDVRGIEGMPDGSVWVGMAGSGGSGRGWGGLARFDGTSWEEVDPFAETDRPDRRVSDVLSMASGPDGTLWAMVMTTTEEILRGLGSGKGLSELIADDTYFKPILIRFDGREWTFYPTDDVGIGGVLAVDQVGRLFGSGEDGLVSFDGVITKRYASVGHVQDVAVAPNGDAWVARSPRDRNGERQTGTGLYLITPEAVGVAE
jgi:hypothetical protein